MEQRADIWALSIPQDSGPNKLVLDPGEDWSETRDGIDGFWMVGHDNSCWAAAGNNLYQYATGLNAYYSWMYHEGVPTFWSGPGGRSYWYSGGDYASECLTFEGVAWHDNWADDLVWNWWGSNPTGWVYDNLNHGKPVAGSVTWGSISEGHVFTIYGMDRTNQKLWIVDSDSNQNGDKPYWIPFRWDEASVPGGWFQIQWPGTTGWFDMRLFDSLESKIWAFPDGGNLAGDGWSDAPSGTKVYEVSSFEQHRPCVVRVIDAGRHLDCLIMGFTNHINAPTSLIIEPAGEFSVRRFLMRDTTLDISGDFYVADQQALDGFVNLWPGGTWRCPYGTTIIGTQADALVDQTGGSALMWSVILGYEPDVKGTYWVMGGTLKYGELVIGDEGRGELGLATGTQVLRNTESHGALGSGSFDPETSFITLGRAPGGRGQVFMDPGSSLETNRLVVGHKGLGDFEQRGGTVTVLDDLVLGEVAWVAGTDPVDFRQGEGLYTLEGDGTLHTGRTIVGGLGKGVFTHSGTAVHETDELVIGNEGFSAAGEYHSSNGWYWFSGGQLSAGRMVVGNVGDGTYTQSGGLADFGEVVIGDGAGTGIVTISGGALYADVLAMNRGELTLTGGALYADVLAMNRGELTLTGTGGILAVNATLCGEITQYGDFLFIVSNMTIGASNAPTWYGLDDGRLIVVNNQTMAASGAVFFHQDGGIHNVGGTLTMSGYSSEYNLESGELRAGRAVFGDTGPVTMEQGGGTADFGESLVLGKQLNGWGEYYLASGELLVDELVIGQAGVGTFTQTGGTATIGSRVDIAPDSRPVIGGSSDLWVKSGIFDAPDAPIYVGYGAGAAFWIGTIDETLPRGVTADLLSIGPKGSVGAFGDPNLNVLRINRLDSFILASDPDSHNDILFSNVTMQLGHPGGVSGSSVNMRRTLTVANLAIGCYADSVLSIASTGGLTATGDLTVGWGALQHGDLRIGGLTLVAGDMCVGRLGVGRVDHDANRLVIEGDLTLGDLPGSSGLFNANSSGGAPGVSSVKAGNLIVGRYGQASFTQTAGYVQIVNDITIGQYGSEPGREYEMLAGKLTALGHLTVGQEGNGRFTQVGGDVQVGGHLILGLSEGVEGEFYIDNGFFTSTAVCVGEAGAGTFTQAGGRTTVLDAFQVCPTGGQAALATLQGGTLVTPSLVIGQLAGSGRFDWRGGILEAQDVFIGNNGVMTIGQGWPYGTSWNLPGALTLEGMLFAPDHTLVMATAAGRTMNASTSALSAGGVRLGALGAVPATFTQSKGLAGIGLLEVGGAEIGGGRYVLSGGMLIAGTIEVGGGALASDFEFRGGTLEAGQINIGTNGWMMVANPWTFSHRIHVDGGELAMGQNALIIANPQWDWDNPPRLTVSAGIANLGQLSLLTLTEFIQHGGDTNVTRDMTVSDAWAELHGGTLNARDLYVVSGGGYDQTGGSANLRDLLVAYDNDGTGYVNLSGTASLTTRNSRIGISGAGRFIHTGGEHVVSETLTVGESWALEAMDNEYELSGEGVLITNRSCIGTIGWGYFRQDGGLHQIATSLDIGPGDQQLGHQTIGEYVMTGGRLEVPVINIGAGGYSWSWAYFDLYGGELETQFINAARRGWFCVYSDRTFTDLSVDLRDGGGVYHESRLNMVGSRIIMRDGEWSGDVLCLESTAQKISTVRGNGYVELWGGIENGGRVIADGFGEDRVLDLSAVAGVVGAAENTGQWGWFARNQGSLLFPTITISGDGVYTVGDDPAAERLGLINSVRMSLNGVNVGGADAFFISLLATDRADIPEADLQFIGVWDFTVPDGMTFASAGLTFRYDEMSLADLGLNENDLRVFHFEGTMWTDVTGGIDLLNRCIFTRGVDSFSLYAVGAVPEPATLTLLALGAVAIVRRRRQ